MPMKNPNHPGDIIRDCLDELGVNVTEGAEALGVTRSALSRLINRKAGVSVEMALRLEKAIGSTAGFWLRLQLNYDLAQVQMQTGKIHVRRWVPRRSLRYERSVPKRVLFAAIVWNGIAHSIQTDNWLRRFGLFWGRGDLA